MEKLRVRSGESNGSGKNPIMPLHNALGIENWPQYIQDECRRVPENDQDRKFIPGEDFLIAGINGEPLTNAWEILGSQNALEQRYAAICATLDYEPEPTVICQQDESVGGNDDDLLDTKEKIQDYYRFLYPWLFSNKVSDGAF